MYLFIMAVKFIYKIDKVWVNFIDSENWYTHGYIYIYNIYLYIYFNKYILLKSNCMFCLTNFI